jgi:hypothetical protein
MNVAVGTDGTITSCSGSTPILDGDTCVSCPANTVCDSTTGTQGTCNAGQYIDIDNLCQDCRAGSYCIEGIYETTPQNNQIAIADAVLPVDCPPGFKCPSTSSYSECPFRKFSLVTDNTCTEEDYLYSPDIGGGSCPTSSKIDTDNGLQCVFSDIDFSAAGTDSTACDAGQMSYAGQECSACDTSKQGHTCTSLEYQFNIYCDPGLEPDTDGTCN